jgi:hypothetical protein
MEDVRFLRENAHEDSYLMVIDSARRDMSAYESPNEYCVEFHNPFKNVIGLDLLDVQLPRSEYTVEEGKNSVVYCVDDGETLTVEIEPGDYNLLQLCEELSLRMEGVDAEPHSTPFSKTSRIRFFSTNPFEIRANVSTLAKSIGFNNNTKIFYSVSAPGSGTQTYNGPFPQSNITLLNDSNVIRQSFVAGDGGPVSRIVIYADEGGSSFVATIVDGDGTVMASATIQAGGTEAAGVNAENDLILGETYYIQLEYEPTPPDYLGTTLFIGPSSDEAGAESATSLDGPWTSLPSGDAVCGEVWVDALRYEISSPGLVDLTGEKYVLIRCPEIESFLHRDRAYEKYHPGLGMVRLGTNGFQEQRFDFVSFPARKLTNPIGKLSQLTFRLEKADGTLYNTRGLNHMLTIVVRYYSIVQGVEPAGSTTDKLKNPAYTPNVTHHMQDRWRAQIQMKDKFNSWSSQSSQKH